MLSLQGDGSSWPICGLASDAARKGDVLPDETIYALPVVGKTLKGVFGD